VRYLGLSACMSVKHRYAVLSAESRAGQYNHADIQAAAAHLHGMLEAVH
jgi:hypothetical protein